MDNNAAIIAALDDSVLSEAIAEASDAAGIRALFAAQGIMITEKAAASAYSALERLRKTSLTSEDLQFLRRDVEFLVRRVKAEGLEIRRVHRRRERVGNRMPDDGKLFHACRML